MALNKKEWNEKFGTETLEQVEIKRSIERYFEAFNAAMKRSRKPIADQTGSYIYEPAIHERRFALRPVITSTGQKVWLKDYAIITIPCTRGKEYHKSTSFTLEEHEEYMLLEKWEEKTQEDVNKLKAKNALGL